LLRLGAKVTSAQVTAKGFRGKRQGRKGGSGQKDAETDRFCQRAPEPHFRRHEFSVDLDRN
jgi:hypothetical protein